jgi:hypothetical protein
MNADQTRCDAMHELVSAALDDALTAREHETLEAHLAECASCRRHQQQLQGLQAELAAAIPRREQVQKPQVLAGATARVSRRRRIGRVQLVAAALAASLLLVSAIVLLRARQTNDDGARSGTSLPAGGSATPPDAPKSDEGRRDLRAQRQRWAPTLVVSARGPGPGDKRAQLWRLLVGTGIAEPLTAPPPGASDRAPTLSPDGARLLFVRQRGAQRQLRWRQRGGRASGLVYGGPGQLQSTPRFICNRRLTALVFEQQGKRLLSRELELLLPKATADKTAGRVVARRAAQPQRQLRSWSRDRCVRTELVQREMRAGKLSRRVLSFAVSSCRGGRTATNSFAKPRREVARWPATIGNNVRDARVSPDGRHVAVLLDRGPVGRPARPRSALLYLITLHDGAAARADAAPKDPPIFVEGQDPGALSMKAQSRFLLWRRLAQGVLGRPRWSADSSQLCFLRRQEAGQRGAWCFAPSRASSKRVATGARLRFAIPGPEGKRLALQSDRAGEAGGVLEVVDLAKGSKLRVEVAGLVAASAPAWLPAKSRGVPCTR